MPRTVVTATLLLFFVLVVAAPASVPVGVAYSASDSMEPTIGVGDGFVVVPAGNVDPGDVVVFESPNRDREYTVHRVVRETPEGFVTKGDANDVTDQAGGYPPVSRSQIRGQVLRVAGAPLVVPNLGVALAAVAENRAVLLAAVAGVLLVSLLTDSSRERPDRPATAGQLLRVVAAVAAVSLVVMLLMGGVNAGVTFVAVEDDDAAGNAIPVGESTTEQIRVAGLERRPLSHVVVSARGATVVNRTWNESTLLVGVRVPPQATPGPARVSVEVYQYPASLPADWLHRLHAVHPAVAALAATLALVAPLYLLGLVAIDRSARLRTGRSRWERRVRRLLGRR